VNGGGQQRLRFMRAYWVTLIVILSYSWMRFLAIFRGDAWLRHAIQRKHVQNARRIQRAIVRLQGLFIKVGQTFSILTNILPPEFRAELEGLQDSVPPRPFAAVKARFIEDFGKEPSELFTEFDETPLAAASISQVHLATTRNGDRVAVKIQYPDIDEMVTSDLKTFGRILRIVELFVHVQGLDMVHREVAGMIRAELDFEEEARNIRRVAANFIDSGHAQIAFPEVMDEYCTSRILTTRFIPGVKVSDHEKLEAAGHDRSEIASRLVDVYCKQIFVDGFYHADPHPGNVLVGDDGTITLLDFGAVAEVSEQMRRGIAHFLQAVINQNTEKIAEALRDMGFIATGGSDEELVFDRVIAYFHERFQESIHLESFNLNDIRVDPEMGLEHLLALRKMDIGIGELSSAFQIPRQWILLERTMLLLTGLCTHLDPKIRPMELVRPYLRQFLLGEDADLSQFLVDTGKEVLVQYLGLPGELRKFLTRASSGRIEVRLRGHDANTRMLYALGHQVIYTMIGVTAAVLATVFHLQTMPGAAERAEWVAWGAGVFLVGSVWRQSAESRRRRRR
jgi:ubiquinone biosynthesis protein